MKKSLIALAFGTLGLGIAEFVMMGILPDVAKALNISIATAGHLISAYAIGWEIPVRHWHLTTGCYCWHALSPDFLMVHISEWPLLWRKSWLIKEKVPRLYR